MVDAEAFLRLSARLSQVRDRLDDDAVTDEQRRRWSRRLAGIAEDAHADLARAEQQLARLVVDVDRHLGSA